MSESNTYYQEWVSILSLTLTNFKGEEIDLTPYFLNIDIQEDIFMPVCSGKITLIDTENMYENFPIIGEEIIKITYKDFYSETISREFSTFGVDNKEHSTESGSGYILNFCSRELLDNRNQTYSKSYSNIETDKIFSDALSRCNPSKEINIEKTQGLQSYIVPNIYPFDVCAQMASRAISTTGHTGTYLFFEDNVKFNFISIEELIKAEPIYYNIGNASSVTIGGQKYIFKNFKFQKPVNNIKSKMHGSQGVETKSLDLMNRKIEDKSYDHYSEDYDKIQRTSSNNPDLKTTSDNYQYKSPQGLKKLIIQNSSDFSSTKSQTTSIRYSALSSYVNGIKIHAELPFNAALTVGMVIDVSIPKVTPGRADDAPVYDTHNQGKYLVMAVRQIISPDHGETIIEIAKDTYTEKHE